MGLIRLKKRVFVATFVVTFILLLAIGIYRFPNVRLIIPLPVDIYSNDVNHNEVIRNNTGPVSLIERIENGQIEQNNPELIGYIKTLILPPSTEPYNIERTTNDTSMGQAAVVNIIFEGKRNGFFIECGALDGETRSNTYFFERSLGWQGILIEGDPSNFKLVVTKHRKAYSINACLSVKNTPIKVVFKQSFNVGKIVSGFKDKFGGSGFVSVQCFPLYSVLLALNRTEVDYFSLDVEGAELDVLKTIPFEKVNIKVFSVEYIWDKEGESGVKEFMESKGYFVFRKVNHPGGYANDLIFIKEGIS